MNIALRVLGRDPVAREPPVLQATWLHEKSPCLFFRHYLLVNDPKVISDAGEILDPFTLHY